MTLTRQTLIELSKVCETECKRTDFVGPQTGEPNFRLIYTSVKTYEQGNGYVIVGLNPGGNQTDADTDDRDRPFQEEGYSAYLDENWRCSGVGESEFQRAVQGISMVVTGTTPAEAIAAMKSSTLSVENRIGADATAFLRSTPSLNIIPFRHSHLKNVPSRLRRRGQEIGWELLCLMNPKPAFIITLANSVDGEIWQTIRENSEGALEQTHRELVFRGRIGDQWKTRYYREAMVGKGPLKGARIVGLPAVVHDRRNAWDQVTMPLFQVLSARLSCLGIL